MRSKEPGLVTLPEPTGTDHSESSEVRIGHTRIIRVSVLQLYGTVPAPENHLVA